MRFQKPEIQLCVNAIAWKIEWYTFVSHGVQLQLWAVEKIVVSGLIRAIEQSAALCRNYPVPTMKLQEPVHTSQYNLYNFKTTENMAKMKKGNSYCANTERFLTRWKRMFAMINCLEHVCLKLHVSIVNVFRQ